MTQYPDPRAIKILFDNFWTPQGWRREEDRLISSEDFEYARSKGLMFDPVMLPHDETAQRAIEAVRASDRAAVVDAFLASLSTRRLDIRSALGSFAVLQQFREHQPEEYQGLCSYCYYQLRVQRLEDVSVLNFERFKWGGVRHHQIFYTAFDLEQFKLAPKQPSTAADVQIFKDLLETIEALPPNTTASQLQKRFPKTLKSNNSERRVLIQILGFCGILGTKEHPGFAQRFVPYIERTLPPRHFVDMAYPACWWRRSDGINQDMLKHWFGEYL